MFVSTLFCGVRSLYNSASISGPSSKMLSKDSTSPSCPSSLSPPTPFSLRSLILLLALILYTLPSEFPCVSTKGFFSAVRTPKSSPSMPLRSSPLPTTFGAPAPWSIVEEQEAYFRHLDEQRAKTQDGDQEGDSNANFEFQRYRQYQKQKKGQSNVQDRFYEQQQERLQRQQSSSNQGSCAGYLCPETGTCVDLPILCPCPSNLDRKVLTGEWYVCLRGHSSNLRQ
ncbi:hypothetical protein EMPS_11090 [Entomortierella parvispora]|uniref:Long chronological lifespan protein 2 n=1 Tax=Entomortierella parvispora TaxID=205924 RepID=A0A9P3M1M4_9FUNG|nr:hypothetical protein EMPS_11090 [Entomortierella parvispora]